MNTFNNEEENEKKCVLSYLPKSSKISLKSVASAVVFSDDDRELDGGEVDGLQHLYFRTGEAVLRIGKGCLKVP